MIELVRPTVDLADSWWGMVDAFGDDQIHGSGYRQADREQLRDPAAFEAWVDWLGAMAHPGPHLPEGHVPCSYRWIVEAGRVVGTIALRHELNGILLQSGGHIGYAVAPGSRRRGIATDALAGVLSMAARRCLDPVLITCESENHASARTIEAADGILEDERAGLSRYWVRTHRAVPALSMESLETPRATLPLVTLEEAAGIRAGERQPGWADGYPREDDLDALRMIESVSPWSPRHVVRRADGLVVGSVGCFGPPDSTGLVEIGYGLVESARGSGLMTEIVATLSAAIEAAGASAIAHTEPDNTASQRVLRRLGFRHEGEDDGEWRWRRARAATG
jgi:predicted acetyltransferase